MDEELVLAAIERDWQAFVDQSRRLGLARPRQDGTTIYVRLRAPGSEEDFLAVLECDDYDAIAPLLDFADPTNPQARGREHWPNIAGAPFNSIQIESRYVPIICTKGTRGYHLHPSHSGEAHDRDTWRLPKVISLISQFLRMGPLAGRGI
jgi:hypothetical protein